MYSTAQNVMDLFGKKWEILNNLKHELHIEKKISVFVRDTNEDENEKNPSLPF